MEISGAGNETTDKVGKLCMVYGFTIASLVGGVGFQSDSTSIKIFDVMQSTCKYIRICVPNWSIKNIYFVSLQVVANEYIE